MDFNHNYIEVTKHVAYVFK